MKHKSFSYYMRVLHRDIGFFLIGLTIIYCISGIVLIYRPTNFFKKEVLIEKNVGSNLEINELRRIIHRKRFNIRRIEGDILYFNGGHYNQKSGFISYKRSKCHPLLEKFNRLHKISSRNSLSWIGTIYAVLLFFLAISSFWMFKPKTRFFKRGLVLSFFGIIASSLILFFI